MKLFTFFFFLMISITAAAQTDSTRVEQYCELTASQVLMSRKVTVEIDFGEGSSFWEDNRVRGTNGKPMRFNSVIDALNYLGKDGWKLVNAFPFTQGTGATTYHYILKKEFIPPAK